MLRSETGDTAVPLVGASVRIAERIQIEHPSRAEVEVAPGQEVYLMLRYRINEGSMERDHYRFRVSSQVGDQRPPDEERVHVDRRLAHDVWLGSLGQRYRFAEPGVYEGTFRATVAYSQEDWFSKKAVAARTEAVEVPVRIRVT